MQERKGGLFAICQPALTQQENKNNLGIEIHKCGRKAKHWFFNNIKKSCTQIILKIKVKNLI